MTRPWPGPLAALLAVGPRGGTLVARGVLSPPPNRTGGKRRCLLRLAMAAFVAIAVGQVAADVPGEQTKTARTAPEPPAAEAARLDATEDLSESLANDVLALSVAVRDRDRARVGEFFADSVLAPPFPSVAGDANPEVKWISLHGWSAAPGADPSERPTARSGFLAAFDLFLDHFSEIEDVRFKVKGATFDAEARSIPGAPEPTAAPGAAGTANVAFYVWGRDARGRREWARGTAEARVLKPEKGVWQFTSFKVTKLDSQQAAVDLFSEVAIPAGLAATIPAYGDPSNAGFTWTGAAAGDFNGDGWLDLLVTGPTRNWLYLNRGDGTFRDASAETGLLTAASGVGPLALDFDNDGDMDIFIAGVGEQVLLENRLVPDGELVFRDVSLEMKVAVPAIGFSAAAADVNGDGRPDIYVASYNRYGQVTPDAWYRATNGTPNLFFVSQPDGTYREEAHKWGIDDRRWSYAAEFVDVDEDGKLDLYVVNDFGEKALYMRRGDRFVDEAAERGVLDPGNGMGVSFGDFNNDGRLDLHVTNMSSTAGNRILGRLFPGATPDSNVLKKLAAGNALYENVGGGRFREVTTEVGPFGGGWAWGGGFIDFDNDGWEDFFTPNGFISGKSMKDT
jgi:hypothetical protein